MMARSWLISGLLAAAALAQSHAAAAQSTSPPFPRLGGYLIGGSVQSAFGTTSYQQQVAKLGAAVISTYPGWSSGGFTMQTAAGAIKAINPNIKLTEYINVMEAPSYWSGQGISAWGPLWTQISNNNYGLRTTYPSGSIVVDTAGNNAVDILVAGWQTWVANWAATNYFSSNYDGMYFDNFFYQPRVNGDYLRNGTTQTTSAIAQNWRNAYVAIVGDLRAGLPAGAQVWANVADWADGSISGYNQVLDGGVIESIIGQSYSYESQGWASMMNAYKIVMNATKPSGHQIFEQDGTASDYQGMRYGLASCLMDNGYYYFNVTGPGGGSVITWFDEFSFNLGAPAAGPAGSATATYSNGGLTVYQNGVWRRDFVDGIALVNPKGNGTQTVTLETSYKHLSGTQAPTINNGQTVTTVTLNDRDGVILQRLTSQPVPDAPSLSVQ
jgi:hypothetical protein